MQYTAVFMSVVVYMRASASENKPASRAVRFYGFLKLPNPPERTAHNAIRLLP